jgi:DNA processing protein
MSGGVCPRCARLDLSARNLSRLWPILELGDAELIGALGGRRVEELQAAYAAWEPEPIRSDGEAQHICRHHIAFPSRLRESALAPHTLTVRGKLERLDSILDEHVVAIVGTRRASDYGMAVARDLARGLAACGLTIVSGLAEGIPIAAHSGALEADGSTLTVLPGGVERCSPAWCRELYHRIASSGWTISETASGTSWRRWWQAGCDRTLALLAELVIVVEAREYPWELACARVAQAHGRQVAAVPGRVSSSASRGTNALLMDGARLVRDPQDALDLLYGVGVQGPVGAPVGSPELEPRLRTVLERVGDGQDTVAKLTASGADTSATALALAELELGGLLLRGDAGRYLQRAGAFAK